ncbi:hypothetical protein [uncultured Ruegeria sp.]|uniref:hypothetical protein n=1 Tax=uncultured Ruegeria sp. TaxID=259304 RepID=UPI0026268A96|nr:hypothetical protein [uncultured Ruegeria sp.]
MSTRSSRSMVTFANAFVLPGYSDELAAGEYEIVVEEELLQSLSFEAFRRTGTYLVVHGKGSQIGRTEHRPITEKDLETALRRDRRIDPD